MTHRTRARRSAHRHSEIAAARGWVREVLAAWGMSDHAMVDDLADGWGTLRTDDGTAVWLVRRTAENAEAGLGRGPDRMGTHR
jgi:hypothetical protein